MSVRIRILILRVKMAAKHHIARAVQLLLDAGVALQAAVRFVAQVRSAAC